MKFQVLDRENKVSGELDLSDQVFNVPPRKDIIARVILWQLAKKRSGNHSVKGKSEVHGTTRKFVRQKGSGGARHGSKKAVQFRGGGVVFGPVLRDHVFSLQKKVRKLGLRMALSAKAKDGKLIVVDSLASADKIKTKDFLTRFGDATPTLFVDVERSDNFFMGLSNVAGYDFIPHIGVNVYDVVKKDKVVISVDAIKELENRLV